MFLAPRNLMTFIVALHNQPSSHIQFAQPEGSDMQMNLENGDTYAI